MSSDAERAVLQISISYAEVGEPGIGRKEKRKTSAESARPYDAIHSDTANLGKRYMVT